MRSLNGMLKESRYRHLVEVTIPALSDLLSEIHPQTVCWMIKRIQTGRSAEDAVMRAMTESRITTSAAGVMLEALRAPWWLRLWWCLP